MKISRLMGIVLAGVVVAAIVPAASAGDNGWRPCGPGGCFNFFIPQGAGGADFRPACQRHDDCYAAGCDRGECDRQFYNDMCAACQCARHPRMCQARAKCYYAAVRIANCCHKTGCQEECPGPVDDGYRLGNCWQNFTSNCCQQPCCN